MDGPDRRDIAQTNKREKRRLSRNARLRYGVWMRPTALYTLVGVVWGTLFAVAVGLTVMFVGAGISWIYLFGDDPWPGWSGAAILAIGLVPGAAVLALFIYLGRRYGRAVSAATQGSPRMAAHARNVALGILAAGLIASGIVVSGGSYRIAQQNRQSSDYDASVQQFEILLASRHRISGFDVIWPNDGGDFAATIRMNGARDGAYNLVWRVRAGSSNHALIEKKRVVDLGPGAQAARIEFTAGDLIDAYKDKTLNKHAANVLVQENFMLEAELAPALDESELAAIPEHERTNLSIGESHLSHKFTYEFPVRFALRGGTPSWE